MKRQSPLISPKVGLKISLCYMYVLYSSGNTVIISLYYVAVPNALL